MKLNGSTKSKVNKDENGENVPHLEIIEVVWLHCNIVDNCHEKDWRVLCTFVRNKLFGELLDISPENFVFFKTFNPELWFAEWFTNQSSKVLWIEDKININ